MKKITRNGDTYYSIDDLASEMNLPIPDREQIKTNHNIIEFEGVFYLNINSEKPPEKKDLSDFDRMLSGIMNVPKPDKN